MNRRFEGKSVLVTGAASGIGLAAAKAFAAEGAHVVLADRNEAEAEAGASAICAAGGKASDDASYLVGTLLSVDGGVVAR